MASGVTSNDYIVSERRCQLGFQAPINLAQAIDAIRQRRYVLPAIQREFVWSTAQIEQLFDSIMRGYPIGSFLFWQVDNAHQGDYQFYDFIREYHERDQRHNAPAALLGYVSTDPDGSGETPGTYTTIGSGRSPSTSGSTAALTSNIERS